MHHTITSPHNPHVKAAARLRERRGREQQGRIIIDGVRELTRAIAGSVRLVEAFVCEPLCTSPACRELLPRLDQTDAEVFQVPENVFSKIAFGERAEGIVGVASTPQNRLEEILLPPNPLVVVLEGLEKPGNLGAVLRSADGAGVSALILADSPIELYNPNAIRASLGTLFSIPCCSANGEETLDWLQQNKLRIFVAQVEAAVPYWQANLRGPTALVLGSEAWGLTSVWMEAGLNAIQLPMRGAADSLNVSATAAVLCYEALRQRTTEG